LITKPTKRGRHGGKETEEVRIYKSMEHKTCVGENAQAFISKAVGREHERERGEGKYTNLAETVWSPGKRYSHPRQDINDLGEKKRTPKGWTKGGL